MAGHRRHAYCTMAGHRRHAYCTMVGHRRHVYCTMAGHREGMRTVPDWPIKGYCKWCPVPRPGSNSVPSQHPAGPCSVLSPSPR